MKIQSGILNELLAATIVALCRLLFRTLRIKLIEADPIAKPFSGSTHATIYLVWHDAILFPMFVNKHRTMVALVSRHRDGSLLAAILRRIHVGQVRGSSSRGGTSAMLEMLDVPADKNIIITPDGPRGPRRQIKAGPLFLASRSGWPIVPTAYVATKSWRGKGTWTDLQIPKPFATVHVLTGQSIHISPALSRDELREAEEQVQAAMDALNAQAERLAQGQDVAALVGEPACRDRAAFKRAG